MTCKKISFQLVFFLYLIHYGQAPANYYDATAGKTGYELKTTLKDIITNGHTDQGYDNLYNLYQNSDTDNYYENDGTVLDMYSEMPSGNDSYEYAHNTDKCGTYNGEGDCYNREHILPQSVFNSAAPMKNDGHFVVPADGYVNNRRSNYPFGTVNNPDWISSNGSKVGPNTFPGYTGTVFEPIDEFKGDIARMLFYIATRYEDQIAGWNDTPMLNHTSDQVFSDWFLNLLLQWHQNDPVSQREIDRNNAVYNYQGNRNPFIDHPEWVDSIWNRNANNNNTNNNTNNTLIAVQDFDGTAPEWSFTNDVAFFDNGADGFYGIHDANGNPNDGTPADTGQGNSSDVNRIDYANISGDFLFVNDLDDEGDNGTSGEAKITFSSIDISAYTNVILSFDYDIVGFDNPDYFRYEIFLDGTGQGEQELPKNNEGTVTFNVPAGTSSIYIEFRIKQNGDSDQAGIDNIKLEGQSTAASSGPQITNITQTPSAVTPSDNVNVSADVTDPDGIAGVELHWGTDPANLNNTINMSLASGNTYTTDTPIPAQAEGTTVYYEVYALDNNADDSTSSRYNYTVACATELIISEYVEGSSNNKYLEIYNGTSATVNMSDYKIRIYTNGSNSPSITITLNNVNLAPGDVYVIAHSSADIWNGTPDQTSGSLSFNGDDAVELYNATTGQAVDIIGQIGNDPGSEWGSGLTSTKDNTLRRKSSVTSGDTDGTDAFDPAVEWNGYARDNVDDLGQHTMNCSACSEPTADASFYANSPQNLTTTSATLKWTPGDGDNRIVIMREGQSVGFVPQDGQTYTGNASFGSGTDVSGNGEYVVYNGNSNTVDVTNLTPGTEYFAKIYEYNCAPGSEDYYTSGNPATDAFITPPEKVAAFSVTCTGNTRVDLTWDAPATGRFDGYLLVVREGATPHSVNSLDPTTNLGESTDYTSAPTYGSTTPYSRILYKGTSTSVSITGLTQGTDYTFAVYAYATGTSGYRYSTAKTLTKTINLNDVTNASAIEGNTEATVYWTNPQAGCYDEILVVANETAGIDFTPSGDGSAYTANSVYAGNNSIVYKGTGTSVQVTGLTNGTTYYFEIFVRQGTEWSQGVEVFCTPYRFTPLYPGDLGILAVNTDIDNKPGSQGDGSGDQIAFVIFKEIEPGTTIYFTDNGYERKEAGKWGNSEGVIAITRRNNNLPAGTIIVIETNDQTNGNILSPDHFDVYTCGNIDTDWQKRFVAGSGGFNLNKDDDIWIMQGGVWNNGTSNNQDATYSGNVLYGWTESGWDNTAPDGSDRGTKFSNLYPHSKCFTTVAPASGGKVKFNDPNDPDFSTTTNDQLDWIALINDETNWDTYNSNAGYNNNGFDYKGDTNCPQMTIASATHLDGVWKGTKDSNWFDCSNWDNLKVPDEQVDVTISGSALNEAVIDASAQDADLYGNIAKAKNLTIQDGIWLEINTDADKLEIHGDLVIQNNALLDTNDDNPATPSDGHIYLYGNWTNNYGTPGLDAGNGTVHFTGNTDQIITSVAPEGTETFGNVDFQNHFNTNVSGNLIATGNLTVATGKVITITDNKYFKIGGDVTNNGQITVSHAGSFVQTAESPNISTGNYTLNKMASHLAHYYDYVYWSTPFSGTQFTMGDLINNAWAYYKFEPSLQVPTQNPDPGWVAVSSADAFLPGKGYAISAPVGFTGGNLNVSFNTSSQAFQTGTVSVPVSILGTGGQDDDDWNLVGNPYPSAIDFDLLAQDNPGIRGAYYAWTNCAGLDAQGHHQPSGYTVYSVGAGAVSACSGTGLTTGRYINSAQGFFVEALNDGNLVFKNSHRVTENNDNFIGRLSPRDRVWIDLTGNTGSEFSQILIGFFEHATEGIDRMYDARALSGYGTSLYSLNRGEAFVIQGLPAWDGTQRNVPVGLAVYQPGVYTIGINRTEGVLDQTDIYIHDFSDDTYHLLSQSDYTVYLDAGVHNNRFELIFAPRTMTAGGEKTSVITIRSDGNGLFEIHSPEAVSEIVLYDLNGRVVRKQHYDGIKKIELNLHHLDRGSYILEIITGDGKHLEKIIR